MATNDEIMAALARAAVDIVWLEDRVEQLEAALDLACSRGCDYCAESIRAARNRANCAGAAKSLTPDRDGDT